MTISILQPAPVAASSDITATANSTAKSNAGASSAIPQDTVTLSPQAQAVPFSTVATASTNAGASAASVASISQEVLQLQNQGLTASQIASTLNIPLSTVEQYSANVPAPAAAAVGR